MLKVSSTRGARAVVLIASFIPLAACVDAKGRFDEYGTRLPIDAQSIDAVDAPIIDMIPNIDGTWLIAINPKPIANGLLIQTSTVWDVTSNGATGTLDGSYQPLTTSQLPPDSPNRVPVGAALTANGVAVDNTASFAARLTGTLPGPANAVSGTEYQIDIVLHGTIVSTTLVCGTVTGVVGPIPEVAGSTFAAIPSGSPLPAPVGECPSTMPVDAGVDALVIDAP